MVENTTAEDLLKSLNDDTQEYKYVRPTMGELTDFNKLCMDLGVETQDMTVGKAYEHFLNGNQYDDLTSDEQAELNSNVRATRKVVDMLTRCSSGELDINKELETIKNYNASAKALSDMLAA